MVDNSKTNLSNLFLAQQRLIAYQTTGKNRTEEQKKLADINNDGKIDSKDKKLIDQAIKDAKKNIFDFTGDNKVQPNDWLLFSDDIDLDDDGEISDAEKKFLAEQKNDMQKEIENNIKSDKYSGDFNGKKYVDGKLASGEIDGKMYNQGVLYTGSKNNIMYQNGVVADKTTINGKYYVDGVLFSGVENNFLYRNGKLYTGTNKDSDGIVRFYKNGEPFYGNRKVAIFDNKNGKFLYWETYKYSNGVKLTGTDPCEDNSLMYKNGKVLTGFAQDGKYYKNGTLYTGIYQNFYYMNGEKATGTQIYKNTLYVNGEKPKGMTLYNNILYKNGNKSTSIEIYDNCLYKNGTKATGTEVYRDVLYQNGEKAQGDVVYNNKLYTNGEKSKGYVTNDNLLYYNGSLYTGTYQNVRYNNGVAKQK